MKRALIAIASVGVLVPAAWVMEANAQQMAPAYPPSPGYGPAPAYAPAPAYGPSRRYARRAYRRSARQTYRAQTYGAPPAAYGGNLTYTPGSGPPPYDVASSGYGNRPFEWHAAPGPNRRGNMCVTHTDPLRGYGYQAACPPAKK